MGQPPPGAKSLEQLLNDGPMDVVPFLRLGASVAAALNRVHSHGLLHQDIKPANILVNATRDQAWLLGPGFTSSHPGERQSPEAPKLVAGMLPYMAPEQTGRMNRSIDARSDLYSFGVVLYRMLTGSLPFNASDPMEWVHCHIARKPVPPAERSATVPAPISRIIMKLLAKTGEERYQTATGVENDLRRCLREWETQQRIDEFTLGQRDTPDRLLRPEKLYGREPEVAALRAAFDRIVAGGTPELVLVSGYSGIGKSSMVNELHESLVASRGLFASGKFDQYKRDIPYATLAQAFQSLVRGLLSKSESELSTWRTALEDALGPNARLIVNLVPELQLVIAEPPSVAELPPQDAQRRFQLVMRRFVGVFARAEHPLALFLDDLQWLDSATLELMQDLLSQSDLQHLLLIGAYRDNEVDASHPLRARLDAIRKGGARVAEIVLAPLTCADLTGLVTDSFHPEPAHATALAELIHEKTAGNPFFAVQFISALVEEGLVTFDYAAGRWCWDVNSIRAKGYTHNVVELMVGKFHRLSLETQQALQLLACMGNSADLELLQLVAQRSSEELQRQLWEPIRVGLVLRSERSYTFLHDRVQEAAYSLIPEEARARTHLRIGRLLAEHVAPEEQEEAIFEIVNQFNRGTSLVTSQQEREKLAELNLVAGKRAKSSSAFASALTYFTAGAALLLEDVWERRQPLAFELELHRADCEVWTGALPSVEIRLAALATRAVDTIQRAAVASRRVDLYTLRGASDHAVAVGLEYLRHVDIDWTAHPTQMQASLEYERIWSNLGSREIEDIIDLPLMQDPESLGTLEVLTAFGAPTLYTDENLYALTACKAVNLSLERGNSYASPSHYAAVGLIGGYRFGDYEAGYRFGRIACDLTVSRELNRLGGKAYLVFAMVVPWTRPVRELIDPARRAFQMATEQGDATYAAYACHFVSYGLLSSGAPLGHVAHEAELGLEFSRRVQFGFIVDIISITLALVRMLRGETAKFGSLDNDRTAERSIEEQLSGHPALALPECFYWIRKLQARFFAGHYAAAVDAAEKAEKWFATSATLRVMLMESADYHFYAALSRAACCESGGLDSRAEHREALFRHHAQLRTWAVSCPENFENRAALVGAEIARVEGRSPDAGQLYENAIRSARASGFVQNEALAYETAARFYAARGFQEFAGLYLRRAREIYVSWGALGKVRQLEELYPYLGEQQAAMVPTSTLGAQVEQLDLATVIKVSQAVSGEMILEKLIDVLMRTSIEHAGAERGVLILSCGAEQRVAAEAMTRGETVFVYTRDDKLSAAVVPESVLQYVTRTQESVILEDASAQNPFSADPYITRQRSRSVLCLPLTNRGTLIGALYFENNLASRVFVRERIAVLKLLASQAAMSLENTRLYRDLLESRDQWRATFQRLLVQQQVTRILAEAATPEEATPKILQAVCEYRGWDLGVLWRIDRDANVLRCAELWRRPSVEAVQFEAATRTSAFPPGRGLPGRVWANLAPVLIAEVVDDPEYPRAPAAARDGLRAACAFPILLGSEVLGVLEFISREDQQPEQPMVDLIVNLGSQLGQFIERKSAENALQLAQAELAHVTRVMTLGELTASIAHEVNQPLGAIVTSAASCSRWLSAEPPNLEKALRALERIVSDGRRASEVIGRIRALMKRQTPRKGWLDINEPILEVVAIAQSQLRREDILLETRLAAGLPLVQGDRVQLQQVLLNLIINAIEAMTGIEERHRELTIVSATDGPDAVGIEVRDSGTGLDPTRTAHLFEPFYTTKAEGIGIGLSISRSIVEAHGGHLSARANTPHGAVFRFSLPVEEPAPWPCA